MSNATEKPTPKKPTTKVPPPGRKLSQREAIEHVNKQFGKALAKLAK
jgi:hypothetical protein